MDIIKTMIQKILSWIGTILYLPLFIFYLLIYELFVRIAFVISFKLYSQTLKSLQFLLLYTLYLIGFRIKFQLAELKNIPKNRPLIIVSNHQAMYDIPCIILAFLRYHVNFVSKKELGKGIPTVSYHLRNGGSVLIDRKDSEGAIQKIKDLGKRIEQNKEAACIYPEGTRSRIGILKEFKKAGFLTLAENAPSAFIVPVVIENTYKIMKFGMLPIPWGIKAKVTILPPIDRSTFDTLIDVFQKVEADIRQALKQPAPMIT